MSVDESLTRRASFAFIPAAALACPLPSTTHAADKETGAKRYPYVFTPGIRNQLEFGGAGILIFDIDDGHRFVRRLETAASREPKPDNIKGVCASAASHLLYFTTTSATGG